MPNEALPLLAHGRVCCGLAREHPAYAGIEVALGLEGIGPSLALGGRRPHRLVRMNDANHIGVLGGVREGEPDLVESPKRVAPGNARGLACIEGCDGVEAAARFGELRRAMAREPVDRACNGHRIDDLKGENVNSGLLKWRRPALRRLPLRDRGRAERSQIRKRAVAGRDDENRRSPTDATACDANQGDWVVMPQR